MEEYEEIIERFLGVEAAQNFMNFLEVLPNIEKVTRHIRWQLITEDPNDDKFADCYLWGNAHYLITHDKHFNVLKKRTFPKVNVVSLVEYESLLENR